MKHVLARLFRKEEPPRITFSDEVLGSFEFERGLGWKARVPMGDRDAELVVGSDGEAPSAQMLQTAKSWVKEWASQHAEIVKYIARELEGWDDEPNLPQPELFEIDSVNILWPDEPATAMIYFNYPGDDIRAWHVTFNGFEPKGLAYDD